MAAELLAPKWFDKNPALSNEDNFDQLRAALGIARELYLDGASDTAFGHFARHYRAQLERGAQRGLIPLVANYGPALIDRARARCAVPRAGAAVPRRRCAATSPASARATCCPDLAGFDFDRVPRRPAAGGDASRRATPSGLVDPITRADQTERVGDGLPETLEEVVAAYGHRWFKLKVAGDIDADLERLTRIAAVLDRIAGGYRASLDGNEQYDDVDGVARAVAAHARRAAPGAPVRQRRLHRAADQAPGGAARTTSSALSAHKPVIIDESDDALDAFVRARDAAATAASRRRPARASTSR